MAGQTPHRCPVCNGRGIVPNGWYSTTEQSWTTTSTTPDQCRSCSGTGVLWEVERDASRNAPPNQAHSDGAHLRTDATGRLVPVWPETTGAAS